MPFDTPIKFNDKLTLPSDIKQIDIEATSDYSKVPYISKIKFNGTSMSYNDGNQDYAVYSNGKWADEKAKSIITVAEYQVKTISEKQWLLSNTNLTEEDGKLVPPPTLNDLTWAQISELSESGKAKEMFKVGDEKELELSTGEKITVCVMGFDHDDLADESGKAGITFGMENCLATQYPMSTGSAPMSGWKDTEMRTNTMETLLSQLPADLQSVIKQVKKKSILNNNNNTLVTTTDKLFLFGYREINSNSSIKDGETYEYWRTVKDGTVQNNCIKHLSNANGIDTIWWLRLNVSISSGNFLSITKVGSASPTNRTTLCGVSFGFCV